ncbi:OLC1v1033866C1 [Oldenlandia corymbosa var. corymbosa]|uniref:Dirigent protein n=1 Tax=Oldenlandia corymbosa var. corymbosa TaxID=529605 RepID=A0AAV1CPC2_OLDCO|nr:OLC1v1033866C1 [Oldenlandia corymbosa var. corymbosa]
MKRLVLLVILTTLFNSHVQSQDEVTKWAKIVKKGKEELVTYKLEFYFHDIFTGKNPSAARIAEASVTNSSKNLFGAVFMVDDRLTVGPDLNSKLVGRARGMYGSAGQSEADIIMMMSCMFLDGIYNGSSFSVMSINHVLNPVREMSIVGGTGLFRLGRGYAILRTYSFDSTTGDTVVGYNVTISAPAE